MLFSCISIIIWAAAQLSRAVHLSNVWVDMTYTFDNSTANYLQTDRKYETASKANRSSDEGQWNQDDEPGTSSQHDPGTHLDAPRRAARGRWGVDEIPLPRLMEVPAAVVDIARNAEARVEDLRRWEDRTGHSLNGTVVLLRAGQNLTGDFDVKRSGERGDEVEGRRSSGNRTSGERESDVRRSNRTNSERESDVRRPDRTNSERESDVRRPDRTNSERESEGGRRSSSNRTGSGERESDVRRSNRTNSEREGDVRKTKLSGMSAAAARWLVDNRDVYGVATESLSPDKGAHRTLLTSNVYVLENVANMSNLPVYGAALYVLPMKMGSRASGAPARIVASYPEVVFPRRTTTTVTENFLREVIMHS